MIDFYKSCPHGEHKCNKHAKYNSFQIIFLQFSKAHFFVVLSCFSWAIEVTSILLKEKIQSNQIFKQIGLDSLLAKI